MKKIIISLLVLAVIAGAGYVYLSRPVEITQTNFEQSNLSADSENGERLYAFDKEQSLVKFTIEEELRGSPFTVIGETNDIRGDIVLGENGGGAPAITVGTIMVDVRTFKTDNPQRDGAINRLIVQTGTEGHEYAVLTNAKATGLPNTIVEGVPFTFAVTGDLMLAGINKPATFSVIATQTENTLKGSMTSTLKRSDYKLVIPNIPFVANVPDTFIVSADFTAVGR